MDFALCQKFFKKQAKKLKNTSNEKMILVAFKKGAAERIKGEGNSWSEAEKVLECAGVRKDHQG